MSSFFLGNLIGVALALLYFWASAFYSNKIVAPSRLAAVPLSLAGFGIRMSLIGIVFYGLSKINGIHFQAVLITFILSFTVITFWKARHLLRSPGPLSPKPIPPKPVER